jgi:hypothetical protein
VYPPTHAARNIIHAISRGLKQSIAEVIRIPPGFAAIGLGYGCPGDGPENSAGPNWGGTARVPLVASAESQHRESETLRF